MEFGAMICVLRDGGNRRRKVVDGLRRSARRRHHAVCQHRDEPALVGSLYVCLAQPRFKHTYVLSACLSRERDGA